MPERDSAEFRPARESSVWTLVIVVVVILAAAFAWWRWSLQKEAPPQEPPAATAPQPTPPDAPPAPVAQGPQNPVDALAEPDPALPALNDADGRVTAALNELLGRKSVVSFLQVDGFVRRVVATVDNLPRAQATSRMWPTHPAPQRFTVQGNGEVKTISADNGSRYTPLVLFAESVDSARAVALYAKLYPLFQQAYEELGYPGRYFNDRLVAVIDHLLQAPVPAGPVQVKLTEVKGEMQSERPWVRYEFVDPELESLSAGQKILVRMGPVNERRMKAKLAELRRQIATGAMAKK
ncbi:DUF3014 domain-containing protein [Variovorax sp. J22R24]|uniref:DUF3014 domain-containing protein n=1 Tax=Variovorax gracilis TaxID=3053502 RepID=UPI002578F22C|nr:DUF3014 domain-containing protein [Variovorax sp. J22R24]MDM0105957.1 DUF3014 domain-containing protein [Variovorax sp. J22R24]